MFVYRYCMHCGRDTWQLRLFGLPVEAGWLCQVCGTVVKSHEIPLQTWRVT